MKCWSPQTNVGFFITTEYANNLDPSGIKFPFLSLKSESYRRKFWSLFGETGYTRRYFHENRRSILKITICNCTNWQQLPENTSNQQNKRDISFHYDKSSPHVSLTARKKFLGIDSDILTHPHHAPNIDPFNNYLFLSPKLSLHQKKLTL